MKIMLFFIILFSFNLQAQDITSVNTGDEITSSKMNEIIDTINQKPKTYAVEFVGTGPNSICSTGDNYCIVQTEIGDFVQNVDRTNTGAYQINFKPGTFTSNPVCQCTGINPGHYGLGCYYDYANTSAVTIRLVLPTSTGSYSLRDGKGRVTCTGF